MTKAIHHIALNCRDLSVTEEFYRKWFGFVRKRIWKVAPGKEIVFCRMGDFYLELFQAEQPASEGNEQPVGFKHFCFQVDNATNWYEQMKSEVEFTVPATKSPAFPEMTIAFFKDPDGNIVQLLENWKDSDGEV